MKTQENGVWDELTDQPACRESYQMRQKMRKNDPYYRFTLMKYLILHLSTLKELKNAKKSKGGPTDQPTDRLTDQPTDRHSDL